MLEDSFGENRFSSANEASNMAIVIDVVSSGFRFTTSFTHTLRRQSGTI